MKRFEIRNEDCREVMKSLPANSVDSIVTDPPYGLEFMGKGWDRGVPGVEFWTEAIRVLKPGGYLLAFGGTRTFHRLTVAIEDSGFEIRDCLGWIYGSGFPKSHNIGKAIDKAAGAEREIMGFGTQRAIGGKQGNSANHGNGGIQYNPVVITAPATPEAANWEGWGTALKPAWEPIILARKPLIGTVAENVLAFKTGGLNIDGCRIGTGDDRISGGKSGGSDNAVGEWGYLKGCDRPTGGRWPANILHDGSAEVLAVFPEEAAGSAARFFYCPKASRADREEGLAAFAIEQTTGGGGGIGNYKSDVNSASGKFGSEKAPARNFHPTVKPSALMGYLCRLVTRPGGTVLDPFAGSGSTGKAALSEGFRFIGAELDPAYAEIAEARCLAAEIAANPEPLAEPDSDQLSLFGEG